MRITDNRTIAQKGTYHTIVVGGGIAGIAAAVASSRMGVRTLLLEKSIVLGGLATAGLINWYEPLCDSAGKKMMGGLTEELIRLSVRYGMNELAEEWAEHVEETNPPKRFVSSFSPTIFAVALDRFLRDSNVELILDSLAVLPVMENGVCLGIVTENKEGRAFYGASAVVDATGDAGVFHAAGAPTKKGKNYLSYVSHGMTRKTVGLYSRTGKIQDFRQWISLGSDMNGNGNPETAEAVAGTTSEEITRFVLSGRNMLFEKIREQDPNSRDILMLPFVPQLRTIRRIVGDTDFTATPGLRYAATIGSCGDFRPGKEGKHYHIPLGALHNGQYPNLLAGGRIISAPYGDAWEVSRVIPVCALTGQAAGTAAAMITDASKGVSSVPYTELSSALRAAGVYFVD